MNVLVSKLVSLSYELFGIFLPGVLGFFYIAILYHATGELGAWLCFSRWPEPTLELTAQWLSELSYSGKWLLLLGVIGFGYFMGHGLKWLSRRDGSHNAETKISSAQRIWRTLKLCPPKVVPGFSKACGAYLQHLGNVYSPYTDASSEATDNTPLAWSSIYPIVRARLLRSGAPSLLATYQNKYTLHRSLAVLMAAGTWCVVVLLLLSPFFHFRCKAPLPRYGELVTLLTVSLIGVSAFSSSFAYFWRLWGDSILSEGIALEMDQVQSQSSDGDGEDQDEE